MQESECHKQTNNQGNVKILAKINNPAQGYEDGDEHKYPHLH